MSYIEFFVPGPEPLTVPMPTRAVEAVAGQLIELQDWIDKGMEGVCSSVKISWRLEGFSYREGVVVPLGTPFRVHLLDEDTFREFSDAEVSIVEESLKKYQSVQFHEGWEPAPR